MYFSDEKVAQMSAYFLRKRGGRMSYMKLIKLLYLADRESLKQIGESISADHHYSMKHGPVLSQTLDLINGRIQSDIWTSWIAAESNHEVSLKKNKLNRDSFDELSDFEIDILDQVWSKFGNEKRWDLVDITHEQLPEWRNPGRSSIPIDPRAQFQAMGYSAEKAQSLMNSLLEKQAIGLALADLC